MKKLIERIKYTFRYTQKLSKTHPFTFYVLLAATFFGLLYSLNEGFLGDLSWYRSTLAKNMGELFSHLTMWMIMLLFAVFLLENLIPRDKLVLKAGITLPVALVTFVYSGILTETCILSKTFLKMKAAIGEDHIYMFTTGYFVTLFLVSLFLCYMRLREGMAFGDYIMGVISGSFLISVVYFVVNLGLLTLTFVFTELLFGDFGDIYPPLAIIATGLYLGGSTLVILTESLTDIPKFMNVLFRYVLYGMSLVAYVIVYLYIIKIIVLQDFPSNSVYGILTALFCFSIPLAYLNIDRTTGFIEKVSRILPYIFAPLIFLQIYTVVVRVHQYGLTPSRYLGIIFIMFEILYVIWYTIRRDTIHYIVLILAVLAFLLTFMPVTNALSVPKITQSLTLRRCLKYTAETIPADARRRMYSAYDYLKNMDNGEKYIDTHYSEERIAELLGDAVTGDDDDYTLSGFTESRSFSCKMMDLDITGFDTITSFQNKYYMDEYKRKIDSIPIYRVALNSYGSEDDSFDTFDATELIELMQSYNFENKYGSEAEPLIFDQDGKRFVITEAFVSYDSLSGEIETLDIEGLLLMKNHN
ncbi:MAG: DUF4153 domain-containing protein [Lachnospiraceae bacterium]|nr:DUF4153 domain-containing protein [Lachnospiraceae bacterium]